MARSKPYIVSCHLGEIELSAWEWQRYVRLGLLREIGKKIARPARNVIVWLDNKQLRVLHVYYLFTSWISIEREAPVRGDDYEETLAYQYGTRDFWKGMVGRRFMPGDFITQ